MNDVNEFGRLLLHLDHKARHVPGSRAHVAWMRERVPSHLTITTTDTWLLHRLCGAFVTDVAITLTVQTPDADPVTGLFEQETKALLNVSPRNVFNAWQMAGLGVSNRVQVTPPSISVLAALP